MENIGSPLLWGVFAALVLLMLAVDLFVVGGGRRHRVSMREAATWSAIWVMVALSFGAALWAFLDQAVGREVANEKTFAYLTGYLIEKSLAVDNIFVWMMLFAYFAVPPELQRRVLVYGVVGAILMRTVMIFAGVWLIEQFHWLLWVFGAFLVFTGIRMWRAEDKPQDLSANPLLQWLRGHLRLTPRLCGQRFFVWRVVDGVRLRHATPLFLALVLVEVSDLIFAVDSIPAIFAITTDPFIVLTSNVFAILGLRSMYFLVAGMADRFALLKYGLAAVLVFIGVKMLLLDVLHIPVLVSLSVVALLIGGSMLLSVWRSRPQ